MSLILECVNLSKNFNGLMAVSNLNLSLESGRIIGLLGPNGSGKTTLIKMAAGLLAPAGGSLLIDGMEPGVETKKIVSYLPERTYFNNGMKVAEILNYFCDFYEDFDRAKAEDMLKRLNVNQRLNSKLSLRALRKKCSWLWLWRAERNYIFWTSPLEAWIRRRANIFWIQLSPIIQREPPF